MVIVDSYFGLHVCSNALAVLKFPLKGVLFYNSPLRGNFNTASALLNIVEHCA